MIFNNIKKLCKEKNISIARLEAETGIGNGTIGRWQKSSPRIDTLKKIADYFGVSIEYFLEEQKGDYT